MPIISPWSSRWWETPSFAVLSNLAKVQKEKHLRETLTARTNSADFTASQCGIFMDFNRQQLDETVLEALFQLAEEQNLSDKIKQMFTGERVNTTEQRHALHVALRWPSHTNPSPFQNIASTQEVHSVLTHIQEFSEVIRSGAFRGFTGKLLKNVICVGIGGSYLGSEFLYEGLRSLPEAITAADGRTLRFLANVDPIDFRRATEDLNPETTLVIIISKTFTTAETLLNANILKEWLLDSLKNKTAISKHMVAVSTNISAAEAFGINPQNVFGFWDWVGGRFSVTSAVGILPLALQFGWKIVEEFLAGCHAMDLHYFSSPLKKNLPVLMALITLWNSSFLDYNTVAILPYCQALHRFTAHIQQLSMESNGKSVSIAGESLPLPAGEIYFGEPGTNGQHSFYQLIHQGRVVPTEFIGFCRNACDYTANNSAISCHDELMTNFFAQPDSLAFGKTAEQCEKEGISSSLIPHRSFSGNRPSLVYVFNPLDY
uniref:Glucose-6-phosphate isomerase n=1 Tax=Cardiosporidium cionae TaxID=476202 RepID=A0A3Q8UBD1_9APIC|nr:glucose-6-phosphate isomerase [Cardiosporidium cionae]